MGQIEGLDKGPSTSHPSYLFLPWSIWADSLIDFNNTPLNFSDGCSLTHLLFADDFLLFVEDNDNYLGNRFKMIKVFEAATILNINLNKSVLSSINYVCTPLGGEAFFYTFLG